MLKLYTNLNLLHLGQIAEVLIPFVGIPDYDLDYTNVVAGRFDNLFAEGRKYFRLTDIDECDACLLPIYYPDRGDRTNFLREVDPFLNEARASGKKIFIFAGHDMDVKIDIANAIIFSGAMDKSTQKDNEYSWPHFFEDFTERFYGGNIVIRQKKAVPVVGFCGFVPPLGIKMGKEKMITTAKLLANYAGIIKWFPGRASHSYRARTILALKMSKKIICNFRIKPSFAFGASGYNTGDTTETHEQFRKNFVDNIMHSDYTVCVRGIGNNSIRFFETICCGKIPVFVDTDSVLPFDFLINWKELCVWVEEKDIDKVAKAVYDFHQKISEEDFIALQKKLRNIYLEYISPLGFCRKLEVMLEVQNKKEPENKTVNA